MNVLDFYAGRSEAKFSVDCPAAATTVLVAGIAGKSIYLTRITVQPIDAPFILAGNVNTSGGATLYKQAETNAAPVLVAGPQERYLYKLPAGEDLRWTDTAGGGLPGFAFGSYYQF